MLALSSLKCKPHYVRLFVPGAIGDELVPAMQEAMVDLVMQEMTAWFKGSTVYRASGSWADGETIIIEPVVIVESFTDSAALEANLEAVLNRAARIKEEMKQGEVAVEIDHRLYLI